MKARTYLASVGAIAVLALLPVGTTLDLDVETALVDEDSDIDPIAEALCSQAPEEVRDVFHTMPWPTAEFPDMVMTTHAACLGEIDEVLDTDCTATNYSLTGWKWNSAYSGVLDTTNPYGLSASGLLSAFNAGGNEWDNTVTQEIFGSISQGGSASKIRTLDGVNQHGFKKGGNYVAVTYTWSSGGNAVESDAAYNTNYGWSLSGAAGKMDVQNVQTHEIGHTFGMGHTTTASANSCLTMYPYVNYGETQKRTLGDGDILGIDARY